MYEVRLQVTQPYHDADGNVVYQPGYQFAQDADIPDGVRVIPVPVEIPDRPAAKARAKS